MSIAGVRNFSMSDLNAPTQQRVVHILSGLINFAKFREMRMQQFQELTENVAVLADQKAQQELGNQELFERLNNVKCVAAAVLALAGVRSDLTPLVPRRLQRAAEEPHFQELAAKETAAQNEIAALTKRQQAGTAEFQSLKRSAAELADKFVRAAPPLSLFLRGSHCPLLKPYTTRLFSLVCLLAEIELACAGAAAPRDGAPVDSDCQEPR